jgi:hypothetical protein
MKFDLIPTQNDIKLLLTNLNDKTRTLISDYDELLSDGLDPDICFQMISNNIRLKTKPRHEKPRNMFMWWINIYKPHDHFQIYQGYEQKMYKKVHDNKEKCLKFIIEKGVILNTENKELAAKFNTILNQNDNNLFNNFTDLLIYKLTQHRYLKNTWEQKKNKNMRSIS